MSRRVPEVSLSLFIGALVFSAACSASDDPMMSAGSADAGETEDQADAEPERPPSPPCTDDGSAEIAVVAAVNNYDDYDHGYIQIYALNATGVLRDTGIKVGDFRIPRAIDIRSDGEEAVVTWGTTQEGDVHGFTVVKIQNGGGGAEVLQKTVLPGRYGPLHVGYVDDDTIVVGRIAVDSTGLPDDLLPLRRQPDGTFKDGTPLPTQNGWPQGVGPVADMPGKSFSLQYDQGKSKLFMVDYSTDPLSYTGAPVEFADGPLFFYDNPTVGRAYFPVSNPADPNNCSMCNPSGLLHDVGPGNGSIEAHPDMVVPNRASIGAVSPGGDTIFLADHVAGNPTTKYDIFGVNLDADGAPVSATGTLFSLDAQIWGLLVSPRGHILSAVDQGEHGILVHTKDANGNYVQCLNNIVLPGNVDLAISKFPTLD